MVEQARFAARRLAVTTSPTVLAAAGRSPSTSPGKDTRRNWPGPCRPARASGLITIRVRCDVRARTASSARPVGRALPAPGPPGAGIAPQVAEQVLNTALSDEHQAEAAQELAGEAPPAPSIIVREARRGPPEKAAARVPAAPRVLQRHCPENPSAPSSHEAFARQHPGDRQQGAREDGLLAWRHSAGVRHRLLLRPS